MCSPTAGMLVSKLCLRLFDGGDGVRADRATLLKITNRECTTPGSIYFLTVQPGKPCVRHRTGPIYRSCACTCHQLSFLQYTADTSPSFSNKVIERYAQFALTVGGHRRPPPGPPPMEKSSHEAQASRTHDCRRCRRPIGSGSRLRRRRHDRGRESTEIIIIF